jgi:hypothetical protein
MLKLTTVPVIALASSEAMKAAVLAISARVVSRRVWALPAIRSWNCSHEIPQALE